MSERQLKQKAAIGRAVDVDETFEVYQDGFQAALLFNGAIWHHYPSGGIYKINRSELKAEMEMQGITDQAELLTQIKLIERGALQEIENHKAVEQ